MNKPAKRNATVLCADFLRSLAKTIRNNLIESFALVAGGLLFFVGLADVLGEFGHSQSLDIADPILGVSFRHLMLMVGVVQLGASLILLFTNWRILGFGLAAWMSANYLVYRIGLWHLGWHHGSGFMFGSLGLLPVATDAIISLVSLFVLVGVGIAFWTERRAINKARFSKAFCSACGGHVKFPIRNLGQQISCPHCKAAMVLQSPGETLKMACVLCGGRVEFPSYAVGQKIACPHCANRITLLKPA